MVDNSRLPAPIDPVDHLALVTAEQEVSGAPSSRAITNSDIIAAIVGTPGDGQVIKYDQTNMRAEWADDERGTPGSGEENVQADWGVTDTASDAFIKNKPDLAPSNAEQNVQADWSESTASSDAFIRNKPTIPVVLTKASNTDVDNETDDTDYITVAKVFRAIARKVKNASTTVRGIVLLARNADVDSSETDTTRVLTVASAKRLISRVASTRTDSQINTLADARVATWARANSPSGTIPDARIPSGIARDAEVTVRRSTAANNLITSSEQLKIWVGLESNAPASRSRDSNTLYVFTGS